MLRPTDPSRPSPRPRPGTSALAACQEEEGAEAPELRPVRTVVVEESTAGETITLSGTVESQVEVDLAFRIGGRLVERLVGVGDTVAPGQVIARLDPADERTRCAAPRPRRPPPPRSCPRRGRTTTASASSSSATSSPAPASSAPNRPSPRPRAPSTRPRRRWDRAAQARRHGARGRCAGRRHRRGRRSGRGRDRRTPHRPARARRGQGRGLRRARGHRRGAPPDPEVAVTLSLNPGVTATGRVREVAPRADPRRGPSACASA
jgi:membrane fusion protein, multidrug efflux system